MDIMVWRDFVISKSKHNIIFSKYLVHRLKKLSKTNKDIFDILYNNFHFQIFKNVESYVIKTSYF